MRQVIIDTDMGADDAHAVVLSLMSEELEILGITTVFGTKDREGNMWVLQHSLRALK